MTLSVENHDDKNLKKSWGRAETVSWFTFISCFLIMSSTPFMVFYFFIAATKFDCSLSQPFYYFLESGFSFETLRNLLPKITLSGAFILMSWIFFQILLAITPDFFHRFVKSYQGGYLLGAVTPAGHKLPYNINGLQAWLIAHVAFYLLAFEWNIISPTIIFDHFGSMLWIANLIGFSLAIFAYVKALYFPSFKDDRKFSGSRFYDFFMGIELNPRVGPIDLKLFFNGRPGIVAWTLINISFAAAQYHQYGHVTNSMWIVNILQALYVLYFFWKEAWYLKTIDIHHDHFGWMLAWGDSVWLPYMYTLQAFYLVFHPVELSNTYAAFVLLFGLFGFYIFLEANNQKDLFRQSKGKCKIWGEDPKSLSCQYTTKDGATRESTLLLSGFWGIARHMNYTGDLILSLAYSLACGFDHPFPYFYFVFLSILLIHRCIRDENRCLEKYGKKWEEYTEKVPYRLIPYIW